MSIEQRLAAKTGSTGVHRPPTTVTALLPAVGWFGGAVAVGGLLWWPETRRWCGLLTPAGEGE
jgi:hypothetical protein